MVIVLSGLVTAVEWQCAHNAVTHAEDGQRITLEYDTPEGDLALVVEAHGDTTHIIKKE